MAGCDRTGIAANVASRISGKFWQSMLTKNMRYSSLELLKRGCSLRFPSIETYQHSICSRPLYLSDSHPVIVHELLRKVIDHALDATANTFGTARFTRFYFTAYLVSFAFRTYPDSACLIHPSPTHGNQKHSQARDLDILGGGGRSSKAVEERRSSRCDESKPAS